jgi:hypothetical protein
MRKAAPQKRSDFDIKCSMILANRKLSLDDKAKAILKLKRSAAAVKKKRF